MRVHSIDHVELFVPDRYEAASWYRSALGLEIVRPFETWAADSRGPLMIATADGAGKLALFEGPASDTPATHGFRRVAFGVSGDDFLRFIKEIAARDVRNKDGAALNSIEVVDHELSYSVYFYDPWGHALEVTTYDVSLVKAALAK